MSGIFYLWLGECREYGMKGVLIVVYKVDSRKSGIYCDSYRTVSLKHYMYEHICINMHIKELER